MDRAFTDGRDVSVGVFGRHGSRNVPTLVNRGWGESFFWDERIGSLEEQVLQPILAEREKDMSVEAVLRRLREAAGYEKRFRRGLARRRTRGFGPRPGDRAPGGPGGHNSCPTLPAYP